MGNLTLCPVKQGDTCFLIRKTARIGNPLFMQEIYPNQTTYQVLSGTIKEYKCIGIRDYIIVDMGTHTETYDMSDKDIWWFTDINTYLIRVSEIFGGSIGMDDDYWEYWTDIESSEIPIYGGCESANVEFAEHVENGGNSVDLGVIRFILGGLNATALVESE